MTPNQLFQSGHTRCFIRQDPTGFSMEMHLSTEDHYITFEPGNIVHHPYDEGTMLDQSQAALIWSWNYDDDVIDIFKAICKALDLYNEEPGMAYKQGYAEGQAAVYKEWIVETTRMMLEQSRG